MAQNFTLSQNQSQSLKMTQQLQQSIQLLQMNSLELSEFIDDLILENPLVIKEEEEEYGYDRETYSSGKQSSLSAMEYVERTYAQKKSLKDELNEQLSLKFSDREDLKVGEYLIDAIDDNGYLQINLKSFAREFSFDVSHVKAILTILKTFEPSGVFSQNIAECLLTQLEDEDLLDEPLRQIILNLDLVAKKDYPHLQRITGLSNDKLKEYLDLIQLQNPYPGDAYKENNVELVTPDLILERDKEGKWQLNLNSYQIPSVRLDSENYAYYKENINQKTDRAFISEKWSEGKWLVKALKQRYESLREIGQAIVEEQLAFFNFGIKHLKPMTLKQIALKADVHESTVSRIVNGKYILSPQGLFELKYFFTAKLSTVSGGEEYSAKTIKYRIKEMIENEESKKILSDDALADKLTKEGIKIARRTVAKYREQMKIPTSSQRKRDVKAAGYFNKF